MVALASNAPPTSAELAKAEASLASMKGSLARWLRLRTRVDEVAAGRRRGRTPPAQLRAELGASRRPIEQALADRLHALLSEVRDASKLPSPDVGRDPNAAVKLATIALTGKLPGEAVAPSEAGFVWLWPAVIVVGMVLYTITTSIKTQADLAAERERLQCIREGACTDYGFWLKVGAIGLVGWIVWEKFGVGRRLTGSR